METEEKKEYTRADGGTIGMKGWNICWNSSEFLVKIYWSVIRMLRLCCAWMWTSFNCSVRGIYTPPHYTSNSFSISGAVRVDGRNNMFIYLFICVRIN